MARVTLVPKTGLLPFLHRFPIIPLGTQVGIRCIHDMSGHMKHHEFSYDLRVYSSDYYIQNDSVLASRYVTLKEVSTIILSTLS